MVEALPLLGGWVALRNIMFWISKSFPLHKTPSANL